MNGNSLRRKVRGATVLLALFVFAGSAVVSYVMSAGKVNEERERELAYIKQQMMQNIDVMFAQAEKLPILISENRAMMELMQADYADDAEEVQGVRQIETDLSSLYRFYPHVESILVSWRKGQTYLVSTASASALSTGQIRMLNRYSAVQADSSRNDAGLWSAELAAGPDGTEERQLLYAMLFDDRFVFEKRINEDAAVTVTVSREMLQSLAHPRSVYSYAVLPGAAAGPAEAPANASSGLSSPAGYGYDLQVVMSDPEYGILKQAYLRHLIVAVLALFAGMYYYERWFSAKLLLPIDRIKRQLADIKRIGTVNELLNYRTLRKHRFSFRASLFGYWLAASVVGVAVIFTVSYAYSAKMTRDHMIKYYKEFVNQTGDSLELKLNNTDRFLNAILRNDNIQEMMRFPDNQEVMAEQFKSFFSYQQIVNKNLNYLNIYNSKGLLVFSTINSRLNEKNIHYRDIYGSLERSGGETVYFNEQRDAFGDHVITVGKKIWSTEYPRQLLGYYLFAINEAELQALGANLAIRSANVIITDSGGQIVYNKNNASLGGNEAGAGELLAGGTGIRQVKLGGKSQLALIERIENPDWYVISTLDDFIIFQGTREIALLNGYLLFIILTLIFVAIFFLSKSISKPITQFVAHLRKSVDGNFQYQMAPLAVELDELDELSLHVSGMVDKIQQLMGDIYKVEVTNREIQLEFKKAELASLMKQINPHFLYNTLETIKWAAMDLAEGDNIAVEMINELSVFLRSGTHTGLKMTTLGDELAHIRSYLFLQQIRYGSRLRVVWNIAPNIEKLRLVRFILQPIVENALLHGIEDKLSRGCIAITARLDRGKLLLEVSDNGQGIPPDRLRELNRALASGEGGVGVGLRNIEQRLQLMYNGEASFTLDSRCGSWTKVSIVLPLQVPQENE